MAHDVFFSHSSLDREAAFALCESLEKVGIRCWIAPRDSPAGSDWQGEIIEAIASTKLMLVLFSQNGNASANVSKEVTAAADSRAPIIPVRLDDTTASATLRYHLSGVHWLDAFPPPLSRHLDRVVSVIQGRVARLGVGTATGESAAQQQPAVKPVAAALTVATAAMKTAPPPAPPAPTIETVIEPIASAVDASVVEQTDPPAAKATFAGSPVLDVQAEMPAAAPVIPTAPQPPITPAAPLPQSLDVVSPPPSPKLPPLGPTTSAAAPSSRAPNTLLGTVQAPTTPNFLILGGIALGLVVLIAIGMMVLGTMNRQASTGGANVAANSATTEPAGVAPADTEDTGNVGPDPAAAPVAAGPPQASAGQTGLDCARAQTWAETTICGDGAIGARFSVIAALTQSTAAHATDPELFQESQQAFAQSAEACEQDADPPGCLRRVFEDRRQILESWNQ